MKKKIKDSALGIILFLLVVFGLGVVTGQAISANIFIDRHRAVLNSDCDNCHVLKANHETDYRADCLPCHERRPNE